MTCAKAILKGGGGGELGLITYCEKWILYMCCLSLLSNSIVVDVYRTGSVSLLVLVARVNSQSSHSTYKKKQNSKKY